MNLPPVPPDLDLTSLDYMPLQVQKLLSSDTWLLAKGDEAKAAVTLWCRAWHQVPAGSLPKDDRLLSALSGAGVKWPKVKAVALRGFVECDDGRLYHTLLCSEALEALEKRVKWREKKRRQRGGQDDDVPHHVQGDNDGDTDGDIGEDTPGTSLQSPPFTGRDGTGRDKKETKLTGFEEFYAAYPRHVGKGAAERAWPKAATLESSLVIIEKAKIFAEKCNGKDPQYIAHPATWLNQRRWEDEDLKAPSAEQTDPNERQMAARLRAYREHGTWFPEWGPKPNGEAE